MRITKGRIDVEAEIGMETRYLSHYIQKRALLSILYLAPWFLVVVVIVVVYIIFRRANHYDHSFDDFGVFHAGVARVS